MSERRVVVVTGATAGVGRAVAHAWARQGAAVALLARGRARLEVTAQEVADLGGDALVVPCDVADAELMERAASAVEARLGPIDVWVNNAVVSIFAPLEALTPAEYRRVTDVAYLGYVWGTMAALRRMRPRDRGTVVQVSSAVAFRPVPLQSAYSGAKAAVMGFTNALRGELIAAGSQVGVTLVHLPAIATPHYAWAANRAGGEARPLDPAVTAEDAARAIVAAADARQRETFVGGQTLQAVLGNALAPEVLDHYLAWRCVAGAGMAAGMGAPGGGGGGGGAADVGNLWAPAGGATPSAQPRVAGAPPTLRLGPPLGAAGEALGRLLYRLLSGR